MQEIILNGTDINADAKVIYNSFGLSGPDDDKSINTKNAQNLCFIFADKEKPLKMTIEDNLKYEGKKLYEYIDELNLTPLCLYHFKIALEIEFQKDNNGNSIAYIKERTYKRKRFTKKRNNSADNNKNFEYINKLSDLIKFFNPKNRKTSDYRLILNIKTNNRLEDKNKLAEVMQQMLYLGIDIEIMLECEENERLLADAFKKNRMNLSENIKKAIEKLSEPIETIKIGTQPKTIENKDEVVNCQKQIIQSLNQISNYIDSVAERDLKVAIMATKKTGKSTLVNSLLGGEYVPAQDILPSPNIITFKKGDKITVNYKGETTDYNSIKECNTFLEKEFKIANNNIKDGRAADDMNITYLSKEDIRSFVILDTPGPNLNNADSHREKAEKCIKDADVVVFLCDYSKYLENDEKNFLDAVKKVFENNNKFHSLIIFLNKLDKIYEDDKTTKSIVKSIDFISNEMKNCNYKATLVHGGSARQYYYSHKILEIPGCVNLEEDFDGNIQTITAKYRGKNEMGIIKYVIDQLGNLKDINGIKISKSKHLKTLRKYSGVEDLITHIEYIASHEAIKELLNNRFELIDREYSNIKNNYLLERINSLSDKKEEIVKEIDKVENIIGDYNKKIQAILLVNDDEYKNIYNVLKADLISYIRKGIGANIKTCLENLSQNENDITKKLAGKSKEANDAALEIITNILNFSENEIKKLIKTSVDDLSYLINDNLFKKDDNLKEHNNNIKDEINNFNEKLNQINNSQLVNVNYEAIEIYLPELAPEFEKIKNEINITYDDIFKNINKHELAHKIIKCADFKDGNIASRLLEWVSRGKWKAGTPEINSYEWKKFEDNIVVIFHDVIKVNINKEIDELKKSIEDEYITKMDENVKTYIENIREYYSNILEKIRYQLNMSQNEASNVIDFLNIVKKELDNFDEIWNLTRGLSDSKSLVVKGNI